ncbi:MAG: DUF4339 domain-containing protein [Planctomycetia bacterium]|nr:DUF4339 domain-containing protein [Planctomycetia bacterium]
MWFYAVEYQQYGPVPENELRRLYHSRAIPADTLVWKQGMADWVVITRIPELTHLNFTQESFAPPAESSHHPSAKRLQTLWGRYILSLGLAILSVLFWMGYFSFYFLPSTFPEETVDFSTIPPGVLLPMLLSGLLCLGLIVLSVVCHCMLLYNLWKIIPPSIARTTPGKAVGFLFIPLFNLYWIFIAYYVLSKQLNAVSTQKGLPPMLSPEFALVTCILSIIPQLNSIGGILLIILFYQMKKTAIQIIQSDEEWQAYRK